jgi:hypothetical protein
MGRSPIGLFDAYDLLGNPYEIDVLPIQDIIIYCETRFRAALPFIVGAEASTRSWMLNILFREVVSNNDISS